MDLRAVLIASVPILFVAGLGFAGPVPGMPDPIHGKQLAQQLCANCHLVDNQQQQTNADVPSFNEIANEEGQTAGAIMAHIVLPKHPHADHSLDPERACRPCRLHPQYA